MSDKKEFKKESQYTECPGSSDPFYTVIYYIKWVTTSWTHSMKIVTCQQYAFCICMILSSIAGDIEVSISDYRGVNSRL